MVEFAPVIDKVWVPDAAVERTFPVKVTPPLLPLLITLLAAISKAWLALNADDPVTARVPLFKVTLPEPKLLEALTESVPALIVVPPL